MHGVYYLLTLVTVTASPTASVTGTVFDSYSRQPVPYAEVTVPELNLSVLADSLGHFEIELPENSTDAISIEASQIGYALRRWPRVQPGSQLRLFLNPRPIHLRGVTVTAFRTPATMKHSGPTTVIDSIRLAERGTTSLGDAIAMAPSVAIKDYANLATIGIRGATSEQTLVLLDGIRVSTAQDNLVELTTLPQTLAERIEILRNGASALYGANSIGGVVNIVTPMPSRLTAIATAGFGSFGNRFLRLRHGNSNGTLGYFLSANLDHSANRFPWQDTLGVEHIRTNADMANTGIFGKAMFHSGTHAGALTISLNASERGVPGPITWPSESARMSDTRNLARLQYGWQQTDAARLDLSFHHHRFWRNYRNPDPFFPQNDTHMTTVSGAVMTERWHPTEWCQLLVAPELADEQLSSTNIGRPRRTSLSAVTQVGISWQGLSLLPALRCDEFRESRQLTDSSGFRRIRRALSPRVWLSWDAAKWASLYLSLNRSYRAPTFNELYWPEDPWTSGNPRLEPELGTGIDCGVGGRPRRWLGYQLAGFRTQLSNLILWQPDSAGVFRPANVDTATITGFEVELDIKSHHAEVRPSLTYLVAKSHGRDLPYRPRLSLTVEHSLQWAWARLGWNVRHIGSRFTNSANTKSLPACLLFDIALDLSPRFGPITTILRTGARNLFDRRYQLVDGYPLPGRSFYAELELRI